MHLLERFELALEKIEAAKLNRNYVEREESIKNFDRVINVFKSYGITKAKIARRIQESNDIDELKIKSYLSSGMIPIKYLGMIKDAMNYEYGKYVDTLNYKCKKISHIKAETGQYVYIIENEETSRVKIGITNNPRQRFKNIQMMGGFKSKREIKFGPFKDARKIELSVHKQLKEHRYIGEWFTVEYNKAIEHLVETIRVMK